MGWVVSVTPWPRFTPRRTPVPIVQEAGWAPEARGKLIFLCRGSNLGRLVCSQTLYWLIYPSPIIWKGVTNYFLFLPFVFFSLTFLIYSITIKSSRATCRVKMELLIDWLIMMGWGRPLCLHHRGSREWFPDDGGRDGLWNVGLQFTRLATRGDFIAFSRGKSSSNSET
jgi:hypothetical protein